MGGPFYYNIIHNVHLICFKISLIIVVFLIIFKLQDIVR